MQALNINWVGKRQHLALPGLLLAVAAALCAVFVLLDYQEADDEWQSLQARKARLARAGQPPQRSTVVMPPLAREEAMSVAQIDARLQRPWDALLHAIEQHHDADVALISIEVQADSGNLHLVAEARDMEHALAYVRSLRHAPALHKVYLSGQEEKQLVSGKVWRFSLDASWSEAL